MTRSAFFAVLVLLLACPAVAQRVAFLTPDRADVSREYASLLAGEVARDLKVVDSSVAESAYLSLSPATPFNLTTTEGKRIGLAIGADAFVLVKAATQRRSAFDRADYFESYASVFCVSSRTGRLISWQLERYESTNTLESRRLLDASITKLVSELRDAIRKAIKTDLGDIASPAFEERPDENSPAAKGFRVPVPYRRLKPEYTIEAALYEVRATVDLIVYLDAAGKIVRTDLERWAGFGLDEAVERNVRSMNWRPAERDGKPIAMKFLVRYNFKKPE